MANGSSLRRQSAERPIGAARKADDRLKTGRGLQGQRAADEARDLDGIIHHRMRLGIVSALAGAPVLTFTDLRALLETTDGNLSVHARKLEDIGYVECTKSFAARRPRTEYRLTTAGRKALQRYLDHMEALIDATRRTLEK